MNEFSSIYLLSVRASFKMLFPGHAYGLKQNKYWVLSDCCAKLTDAVAHRCGNFVDVCKRRYKLSLYKYTVRPTSRYYVSAIIYSIY